jgi:hypothetical protein
MFVVGDLVFFIGHDHHRDTRMMGVVLDVKYDLDPLYEVYWFEQNYKILHSGMQLESVYVVDNYNENIKINVR